ncbi:VanZ family protein [Tenacibaculum sp.]|nr:VanZ family protein [Tenacibaculum sp.]
MHIKHLLKGSTLLVAIIITVSIAILSFLKIEKQPVKISNLDKIEHAVAYFTLAFFWLLSLARRKVKYLIIFSCLFYGIIIEVLQTKMTSYRTGDYFDVIANSMGILMALLIFNCFFEKKLAI